MAENKYRSITVDTGTTETDHLRMRPVWRCYWKWFFVILLVMLFAIYTNALNSGVVVSLLMFNIVVILRYRLLFTVTSKRVIMRVGLIAKNTNEVEIRHARELRVRQGIAERLLNYGDVEISTAAGTGPEVIFNGISDPHDFKEALRHVRNGL
jgi:uncharacterized membrane protein YdbT with pleckstrin-like domain